MQRAGQDDSFGAAPRLTGANSVMIFVMGPVIPLFGAGLSTPAAKRRLCRHDEALRVLHLVRSALPRGSLRPMRL